MRTLSGFSNYYFAVALHYLPHRELSQPLWNACLAASPGMVPYAHWWWLAATAGRWDAVVELDAEGRYLSVFPLPIKRRPWGHVVCQPPFTQQLGLFLTAGSRHREVLDYLAILPGRFARFYLQLRTGQELVAAPAGYQLLPRHTYQLSLAPHYPALLAGFSADYRRRLRRHLEQPQPLVVSRTTNAAPLIGLFRAEPAARAAGLKPRHYSQLARLLAVAQQKGHLELLEVRAPVTDELLAAAAFIAQPQQLIYLFAAASGAGKQAGAPLLLLHYMIQRHAGTPGLVLDFEGGMLPSIARFFANFGATAVPYVALSFTQLPRYLQWLMR